MNLHQKNMWNVFTKNNRLILTKEAIEFLLETGNGIEDMDLFLEKTALAYKKLYNDSVVDLVKLKQVINKKEDKSCQKNIINMFSLIDYYYDKTKKTFILSNKPQSCLKQNIKTKDPFKSRYLLLKEAALDFLEANGIQRKITTTKEIGYNKTEFVFGWLFKKKNVFYIEDENGEIEVDFTKCQYYEEEIVLLNSFVLITGTEGNGLLFANWIRNLPIENIRKRFSSNLFEEIDFSATNGFLLFISGVFMDECTLLDKFERCLEKLEETKNIPFSIFLFGPFFRKTDIMIGKQHIEQKRYFDSFITRIGKYPLLKKETHFFLIPNTDDPFKTCLFPRGPIPKIFFDKRFADGTKIKLTTLPNPTKINILGQNIILFSKKKGLEKHQMDIKNEIHDVSIKSYFKAMLTQASLCTGKENIEFVCWEKANDLIMFPYPDLFILSDEEKTSFGEIEGTKYIKIGSFMQKEQAFFTVSLDGFIIKEHSF